MIGKKQVYPWIHALLFADIIIMIVPVATKGITSMANENIQDNSEAVSLVLNQKG